MHSMPHFVEECLYFVPLQRRRLAGCTGIVEFAEEDDNGQLVDAVFTIHATSEYRVEILRELNRLIHSTGVQELRTVVISSPGTSYGIMSCTTGLSMACKEVGIYPTHNA